MKRFAITIVRGAGAALDRLVTRLLRRRLNAFAKSVVSEVKQRGGVSNYAAHEIYGEIDRRLWPEWYR